MRGPRPLRSRRARPAVVTVTMAILAAACAPGDGASPDAAPGRPPPASTEATTAPDTPAPEQFAGPVEEFYEVPDPLPAGQPGQLIRIQELGATADTVTLRIMYHSRDARDRDRAVTGVVTYPTGPAPPGGWPVVSWAHGTTGLASQCAPSRTATEAPALGVGGVRVATDYLGLGPVGELHPYLSRPSEGHSVIDAVRAARLLPDTNAGPRWLSVGHSQGGHAALSAHELAADYAPELTLIGTLAFAPAAVFDKVYGGIDPIVAGIVGFMGFYGSASEHPEVDRDEYLTPAAVDAGQVLETACLDQIISTLLAVGVDSLYQTDPLVTEPARSAILDNDVGHVTAAAPLFLVSGTTDDRVVIERVLDLYDRLCEAGQVTELLIVDGANHGTVIPQTSAQTAAWLNDRVDGNLATDSCANPATR